MGRMVSRSRPREGRGLGEILSEYFMFILIGAGVIAAGYWYVAIYQKTPEVAMGKFINAIKRGNTDTQYEMLSAASRQFYKSKEEYDNKLHLGHGLTERIANEVIPKTDPQGDRWEADITLNIRQKTASLTSSQVDPFTDHYVLKREGGEWKIDLTDKKSNLSGSFKAVGK